MEKQNSQIFRPWNICIVRKGHIESGTHLRQNIVGRIWKKKLASASWAVKSSDFRRGPLNGAVGRLQGAFYHRVSMGAENGEWGLAKAGEGRDAAIQSQSCASWAGTQELYSPPIHPNRYAMLICILRIRQFTRINMLICFWAKSESDAEGGEGYPFVQVGSRVQWVGGWGEGGDRHTCICSSWTLGWTMEIWLGVEEDAECTLVGAWGGRC